MARTIEMVKRCLKEKKMTQTELAMSLGEDVRTINQQLNRQKDLKAERFFEVMEHIGYMVELVDNEGIRKVSNGMIDAIQCGAVKGNMFYTEKEDGSVIGIYSKAECFEVKEFGKREDCFDWLLSHA